MITALQNNIDWAGFDLQLFAVDPPAGGERTADPVVTDPPTDTDPAADGDKALLVGDADPAADGSDKAPEGAPEEYKDFTVPDGMTFDKESATDFLTTAKELNLSQEQAQKLVDLYGTRLSSQQEAQQKQSADWAAESKKQYKKVDIELANKALSRFADKDTIDLLASTGLGNHPKLVGLFKSIGSQISEGKFVEPQSKGGSGKHLYSNSPDMYK